MIRERVDSRLRVMGFPLFWPAWNSVPRCSKTEFHYERSRHRWLLRLFNGLPSLEYRRTKKERTCISYFDWWDRSQIQRIPANHVPIIALPPSKDKGHGNEVLYQRNACGPLWGTQGTASARLKGHALYRELLHVLHEFFPVESQMLTVASDATPIMYVPFGIKEMACRGQTRCNVRKKNTTINETTFQKFEFPGALRSKSW